MILKAYEPLIPNFTRPPSIKKYVFLIEYGGPINRFWSLFQ